MVSHLRNRALDRQTTRALALVALPLLRSSGSLLLLLATRSILSLRTFTSAGSGSAGLGGLVLLDRLLLSNGAAI